MVAPVPAHISKLPPRKFSCPSRRQLSTTYHSLPTALRLPSVPSVPDSAISVLRFFPSSNTQLLCFLSHPCNPSSFMRLRTLSRNGAPLSLALPRTCALFLSPRRCTLCALFPSPRVLERANSFVCIDLEPLCRLFVLFSSFFSFVFNRLQPLFRKYRGWGIPNACTGHPGVGVA
jgi:hypothetical protein